VRWDASYGDRAEKTLGHVSDNDSDEKDDGVEPVVAECQSDDEENDSQTDGEDRDEVDETVDLTTDRSHVLLESWRQECDPTHQSVVTNAHHDTHRFTCSKWLTT